MKGIREAAMGSQDPEPTYKTYNSSPYAGNHYNAPLYDDDYDFDKIDGMKTTNSYKAFNPKTITVILTIETKDIGDCADDLSPRYNPNLAHVKATEIAYDRIEELAGKNYESRYTVSFEIIEGLLEYEATITLTPTK